jgi:hypothetical protein
LLVNNGQLIWIELAVRASGGYFATHEIPLSTGINFVEILLKLAVGATIRPEELLHNSKQYVCQRYLFSQSPEDVQICPPDLASGEVGVLFYSDFVSNSRAAWGPPGALSKVAVVITGGSSQIEAEDRASRWVSRAAEASTGIWNPPQIEEKRITKIRAD